jgi:hypothetical protein
MDSLLFKTNDVEILMGDLSTICRDEDIRPDVVGVVAATLSAGADGLTYLPPTLGLKIDAGKHLSKRELKRVKVALLQPCVLIPLDRLNLAIVEGFGRLVNQTGLASLYIAKLNHGR